MFIYLIHQSYAPKTKTFFLKKISLYLPLTMDCIDLLASASGSRRNSAIMLARQNAAASVGATAMMGEKPRRSVAVTEAPADRRASVVSTRPRGAERWRGLGKIKEKSG